MGRRMEIKNQGELEQRVLLMLKDAVLEHVELPDFVNSCKGLVELQNKIWQILHDYKCSKEQYMLLMEFMYSERFGYHFHDNHGREVRLYLMWGASRYISSYFIDIVGQENLEWEDS